MAKFRSPIKMAQPPEVSIVTCDNQVVLMEGMNTASGGVLWTEIARFPSVDAADEYLYSITGWRNKHNRAKSYSVVRSDELEQWVENKLAEGKRIGE